MHEDAKELLKAPAARTPNCPRCAERGKTWKGDNPTCAFPGLGEFSVDNWNCATMNALRDLAEQRQPEYSEDQYAALIPDDGAFLVLGWYKRRGRTEFAAMLSGETMNPFRHEDAVRILKANTRECEGCGLYKPIEEMATGFLPGTGETYQCEACRGG